MHDLKTKDLNDRVRTLLQSGMPTAQARHARSLSLTGAARGSAKRLWTRASTQHK